MIKLDSISSSSLTLIVCYLRSDIKQLFLDKEIKVKYQAVNNIAFLLGIKKTILVILKKDDITVFYMIDIDEDESYLVLKYGKILLEDIGDYENNKSY